MFTPQGPGLRELAVQALSSVERGYDLLAPKFDHTPFRTPEPVLEAMEHALAPLGPFDHGLDLCCGTGAGMGVLSSLCHRSATGVDLSAGMLAVARERDLCHALRLTREGEPRPVPRPKEPRSQGPRPHGPRTAWVRGDARALPFGPAFDLAVSFGAFGHFLPAELPGLFTQVHAVLRPGGRFAFPLPAPAPASSPAYWALLGFDAVMRVRNAVWRPPFVMYYRSFCLGLVRPELERAGFDVTLYELPAFGHRPDGSPRCRLVVATRPDTSPAH